jgi:hypothetical protein
MGGLQLPRPPQGSAGISFRTPAKGDGPSPWDPLPRLDLPQASLARLFCVKPLGRLALTKLAGGRAWLSPPDGRRTRPAGRRAL